MGCGRVPSARRKARERDDGLRGARGIRGGLLTASVFVGVSLDGFLARPNGAFDFLPPGGGEPHGYDEFMAGIDALVIGRNTFETVLAFPEWPMGANGSSS